MLKNPKHAFWQAFFLVVVVFIFGLFIGIAFEGNKVNEINDYYVLSEISLMDAFTLNSLVVSDLDYANCDILIGSHLEFADRIYEEAYLLEQYEDSGKITDGFRLAHKKYDLLRTLLWINLMKMPEECKESLSTVVYLYEYETDDLVQKATQKVWSKVLFDLKQEKGKGVILIPIAADSDLTSLNSLLDKFEISEFPIIVINEKKIINELSSVEDLEMYLE